MEERDFNNLSEALQEQREECLEGLGFNPQDYGVEEVALAYLEERLEMLELYLQDLPLDEGADDAYTYAIVTVDALAAAHHDITHGASPQEALDQAHQEEVEALDRLAHKED